MAVQPDHAATWDEFSLRQAARETGEEPALPPKPKRQESLSSVLLEAIHLAGARHGRLSRAERIREMTLLEVLSQAMRRAR
jgi:hypothetical protein